jgi:hypothetical protein
MIDVVQPDRNGMPGIADARAKTQRAAEERQLLRVGLTDLRQAFEGRRLARARPPIAAEYKITLKWYSQRAVNHAGRFATTRRGVR